MNNYKAGDFTNGKMNEIFKSASGVDFGVVDIEHKQQGSFKLMSGDGFNAIVDSILRFNFGIIKIDGVHVSVFDYAELKSPSDAIIELDYIIEMHGLSAEFINKSYKALHHFNMFDGSLSCHHVCDMISLNASYQFNSIYSRHGAGMEMLKKKKITKDQVDLVDSLCGNFEAAITKAIESNIEYMIENENLDFSFDAGSLFFDSCDIMTDKETCLHSSKSIDVFNGISNDLFKMILKSSYFYAKFDPKSPDEVIIN